MVYDLLFAHGICKSRDYDCVMLVLPPKLKQIHQSKSKDQNSSTNLDETSCKILGVASNWMRVIKCLALQTRMKKNKYLWLINLHLPLPSWRVSYSLCYQTVDEINTRGKQSQLCCNYIEPSRLLIILSGF